MNLDKEISNAKSIAITGHVNPDGDCIGSTLSMYNYIINQFNNEKEVDIYLQKSNKYFSILKSYDKIYNYYDNNKKYDLIIILDCASIDRIGDFNLVYNNSKRRLVIDHHKTNSFECDDSYILPDISSTCEICYELYNKEYMNKDIAECIYTGIIHDTGSLRYKSTTKRTVEIVADLFGYNIDFNNIQEKTIFTKTFNQQKVTGFCLGRLERFYDNKVVYTFLTLKEQMDFHVDKTEIDNIITYVKETEYAEVAIFAYEIANNLYKISLRSNNDNVDVSVIASCFSGGGHKLAAGGQIQDTPENIINKIIVEIKKQI